MIHASPLDLCPCGSTIPLVFSPTIWQDFTIDGYPVGEPFDVLLSECGDCKEMHIVFLDREPHEIHVPVLGEAGWQ